MSKRSFVDSMLALAIEKEYLEIIDDQYASPTYAPDLADFTCCLIEGGHPYGIYHGANAGGCSWYEWTKKIFEIRNMSVDLRPTSATKFPRPAKAPKYSILENTKLPLQRGWEDTLKEYLAS
jgi:dTDP-4-dehydrorhamnose reductase